MKLTHLIASLAIIACTTIAWFILGAALSQRTSDSSRTLRAEVSGVWGPAITQQHPHAWFDTPNAVQILEAQAEFPLVRGIRSKPVTGQSPDESVAGQRRSMQDPKWLDGYRRLGELGLSWDLRVPYWHLEEAAKVAADHPDVPVVLNHTGFPWMRTEQGLAGWRSGMRALARIPHVWLKLSCVCVPGEPWSYDMHRDVIREAIDIFGPQRCMFASNVPPDTLQASFVQMMDAYKAMVSDFSRPEQERMFLGAAAEFYRVEPITAT